MAEKKVSKVSSQNSIPLEALDYTCHPFISIYSEPQKLPVQY